MLPPRSNYGLYPNWLLWIDLPGKVAGLIQTRKIEQGYAPKALRSAFMQAIACNRLQTNDITGESSCQ